MDQAKLAELKEGKGLPRDPAVRPKAGDRLLKSEEDGAIKVRVVDKVEVYHDGFLVFYNNRKKGTWIGNWTKWAKGAEVSDYAPAED